ncbi:hypothetical protein CH75_08925 [Dyella jiangningensis]|nr:hypothetical protein CH75_08925 [Dyella jiangningensis]
MLMDAQVDAIGDACAANSKRWRSPCPWHLLPHCVVDSPNEIVNAIALDTRKDEAILEIPYPLPRIGVVDFFRRGESALAD